MKKFLAILFVLCIYVFPVVASAHSGGTDANGGHHDGNGDYHYHHGQPAHDHYDMDNDGDIDCPYGFENGTKPSTGTSTGKNNDSHTSYGYSDGYRDGYEKGYQDGEFDGENTGYKSGYSDGSRDKEKELKAIYEAKLQEERESAAGSTIFLLVFFGWPILAWFNLLYITRKLEEKDNLHEEEIHLIREAWRKSEVTAIIKYITPGSENRVQLPKEVYFDVKCIPVKGAVTKVKPFGDFTVYVSESGVRFHERLGCSTASKPIHLYEALETATPCLVCCKLHPKKQAIPDWYVMLKHGWKTVHSGREDSPKSAIQHNTGSRKPSNHRSAWLSSSVIERAEYYNESIYLTFKGGSVYRYHCAPVSLYEGIVNSSSPGNYFHEHIDGKFRCSPQ